MKVLVIGAGNMGLTYAEGMSKSELLKNNNIMVLDKSKEKLEEIRQISHFDTFTELSDCVTKADIIFVAVKPYHAEALLKSLQPIVTADQIIISIMAGVTLDSIRKFSGIKKVIRAMPNLPAKVGLGLTTYVASPEISETELSSIGSLLNTTGKSIQVANENLINASTAISGSGPAYVFYFMQSMKEAALQMGFSENDAKVMVSQTFVGALELFNQSDISLKTWMEKVTSKGGTTQAALEFMDKNKVNELIKEAAFAAFNRAIELGKEN